ncbi:MAG: LPS export ABC transporter periplasmic protein LptC [Pseudomonadota bacterium]
MIRNSGAYAPRRLSALGRGYSHFVRVLKFILPLAALAVIGILIARLAETPQQPILASLPKEEKTTPGQIELVQARYEGVDDRNRPYTVTADKAVRDMGSPDAVLFENLLADITLQDKTWVAVRAGSGSLDRKTELLSLKDDVTAFHDSGYEMRLQDLRIDLKRKAAVTTLPVRAQGPMGTVAAQSLSVEEQGDLIVFGGPATLTIFRLSSRKERG